MPQPTVRAWFEVLGFAGSPDAVSERLGQRPSEVWLAGEPRRTGGRPHEESGWRLVSPLKDCPDLEEHTAWLLDRLPREIDVGPEEGREWYRQFTYVVEVQGETPAMCFAPDLLARIASLGAGIDIDLYVFSGDE